MMRTIAPHIKTSTFLLSISESETTVLHLCIATMPYQDSTSFHCLFRHVHCPIPCIRSIASTNSCDSSATWAVANWTSFHELSLYTNNLKIPIKSSHQKDRSFRALFVLYFNMTRINFHQCFCCALFYGSFWKSRFHFFIIDYIFMYPKCWTYLNAI